MTNSSEKPSICVFIDTFVHLRTAQIIQSEYNYQFKFITTNQDIFIHLKGQNCEYIHSYLNVVPMVLRLRRQKKLDGLLAARVDSIVFQLLYYALNFQHLYTFDEGLYSIQNDSRYNSKIIQPNNFGRFYRWGNKILNFPKNPSFFYQKTKAHFSFFEPSNFIDTLINPKNIQKITILRKKRRMRNIFIGQPWQNIFQDNDELCHLGNSLKELKIDLYIYHPRESKHLIAKYLDDDVIQINSISPAEDLIEALSSLESFNIFTVASTLAVSIPSNQKLVLIESNLFNSFLRGSQNTLKKALEAKKIDYSKIEIPLPS